MTLILSFCQWSQYLFSANRGTGTKLKQLPTINSIASDLQPTAVTVQTIRFLNLQLHLNSRMDITTSSGKKILEIGKLDL